MSDESTPIAPMPMMAIYGYTGKVMETPEGQKVLAVHIQRTCDVEYADGITLEEHLVSLQGVIAEQNVLIAKLNDHSTDMALFLSERFGYEYKNHSAADAFVPLFEYVEKVPTPEVVPPTDGEE